MPDADRFVAVMTTCPDSRPDPHVSDAPTLYVARTCNVVRLTEPGTMAVAEVAAERPTDEPEEADEAEADTAEPDAEEADEAATAAEGAEAEEAGADGAEAEAMTAAEVADGADDDDGAATTSGAAGTTPTRPATRSATAARRMRMVPRSYARPGTGPRRWASRAGFRD